MPTMPWAAPSRWRARPTTLLVLVTGLWLFGTGEALLVASHLGNTPWTVLAQGLSRHSPLTIGTATFAISLAVLTLWLPLRERPGLGTILNAIVVATAIDAMLPALPTPHPEVARLGEVAAGIVAIGVGSAFYLTTALGPGPRDGWMTGLARRTGWSLAPTRLAIELTALTAGYLLGGRVGIATVLFAALIGVAVQGAIAALVAVTGSRREAAR